MSSSQIRPKDSLCVRGDAIAHPLLLPCSTPSRRTSRLSHVIRHQAIGPHRDPALVAPLHHQRKIPDIIGGAKERLQTPVAPLRNMMRQAGNNYPRDSCHEKRIRKGVEEHKKLVWCPLISNHPVADMLQWSIRDGETSVAARMNMEKPKIYIESSVVSFYTARSGGNQYGRGPDDARYLHAGGIAR